jgi:hypothetical protein
MRNPLVRALAVLVILLPACTAVLLRYSDVVRETVVVPALYLAWLTGRVLGSLHQGVFWSLLLAGSALLLFFSVRSKAEPRLPMYRTGELDRREGRRVDFWARQLGHDRNDLFWGFRSVSEFRRLILAVWACRQHTDPQDLEQRVREGAFELPPELRPYFEREARPHVAGRDRDAAWQRLYRWLRARLGWRDAAALTASEAALAAAIERLETTLRTQLPELEEVVIHIEPSDEA